MTVEINTDCYYIIFEADKYPLDYNGSELYWKIMYRIVLRAKYQFSASCDPKTQINFTIAHQDYPRKINNITIAYLARNNRLSISRSMVLM